MIWFDCLIWLCLYRIIYICISMGGQLNGNFLPGSLPHKFILFATLILCFVVNKFLYLSLSLSLIPFSQILPTTDSPVSSALNPRTTPTRAVTSEHFCFCFVLFGVFSSLFCFYILLCRRTKTCRTDAGSGPPPLNSLTFRPVVGQLSEVVPFLLVEQRCGMACQAMLRRPRRCRCSRTG